jgi:pyruvate-formate lyase-activating enzyme
MASKNYLDYLRIVSIETLVACNASCSFCAYPDSERKGERMETSLFYKIISDLAIDDRYPQSITLARINEPLLDKRLKEFSFHIVRQFPKSRYSIWSNGSRLNPENIEWMQDLGGNITLQISLNSINSEEHYRFMGIELSPVLKNLDHVHEYTTLACNLHAPFVSEEQSRRIHEFCNKRWPRFKLALRPVFDWQGKHPNGVASSRHDLSLSDEYEESFKDFGILNQACSQWLDLHILASGYATKSCIDEAGFTSADFLLRENHALDVFAKTRYLREKLVTRKGVAGCTNCLHPG